MKSSKRPKVNKQNGKCVECFYDSDGCVCKAQCRDGDKFKPKPDKMGDKELSRVRMLTDEALLNEIRHTPIGEHPHVKALVERFQPQSSRIPCPVCKGRGKLMGRQCKYCDGTGVDLA